MFRDTDGLRGTFKLTKGSIVSIDSNRILYFETSVDTKHTVVVYTANERLEFRGSLSHIIAEMDKKRFYQCGRSLVLNLEHITALDIVKLQAVLADTLIVDIPAKYAPKLVKRINDYKGR